MDATQGVQAQTLANGMLAQQVGLRVIPVINKIDLPSADVNGTLEQIFDTLKIIEDPVLISAKSGAGIQEVLDAIIREIPAPSGDPQKPLSALIFDSSYSIFRGVILLVRVVDGLLKKGMKVKFFSTETQAIVEEVGYLKPKQVPSDILSAGGGYVIGIGHQYRASATRSWRPRVSGGGSARLQEASPSPSRGYSPIDRPSIPR